MLLLRAVVDKSIECQCCAVNYGIRCDKVLLLHNGAVQAQLNSVESQGCIKNIGVTDYFKLKIALVLQICLKRCQLKVKKTMLASNMFIKNR